MEQIYLSSFYLLSLFLTANVDKKKLEAVAMTFLSEIRSQKMNYEYQSLTWINESWSPYDSIVSLVGLWPQSCETMIGNLSWSGRYFSSKSMDLLTAASRLQAMRRIGSTGPSFINLTWSCVKRDSLVKVLEKKWEVWRSCISITLGHFWSLTIKNNKMKGFHPF